MMTTKDESDKNKMSDSETLSLDNIIDVAGEDSVSLTWRSVTQNDESSLNQDFQRGRVDMTRSVRMDMALCKTRLKIAIWNV